MLARLEKEAPNVKKFVLLLAALSLFATACGSTSDDASESGEAPDSTEAPVVEEPATTTEAMEEEAMEEEATDEEVESELNGIVSISPTATEILFAIGAGEQVIAADEFSNYPAEAPTTDLSGFTPNIEAIAALSPQTVIMSFDANDLAGGLEALGIDALVQFSAFTLDDTYAQIADLGILTGHEDEAAALVADIRTAMDDMTLPASDGEPLTYYHELDPTYYSPTSTNFIGEVYNRLGLVNIADEADDGSSFPQLTEEYILAADPDFIFLADTKCCGESVDTVAARPGWDALTAVKNGQVIELDDDIVSRWGPRVTDFMSVVAEAVANSLIPA